MEIIGNFNERLVEAIADSGMTQAEVASLAGVSRSLLNKYVKGANKAGNVPTYNLARVLRVNVLWLMGYDVPKREDDEHKRIRDEVTDRLANLTTEQLWKVARFIDVFVLEEGR